MEILVTFLVVSLSGCIADKFWDDLLVTNSMSYTQPLKLPRTQDEALQKGWSVQDLECDGLKGYKGYAWVDPQHYHTLALLFDENGYIAGIQPRISQEDSQRIGVPSPLQMPPFVKDPSRPFYSISLYFVEPSKICRSGRTTKEFQTQGTGQYLYIQHGDMTQSIAKHETNIQLPWELGKCYIALGNLYWYDMYEYMTLNKLYPIVPIYNGGDLNGFSVIMSGRLDNKIYGHIPGEKMNEYLDVVPKSFEGATFSMYHVFFTSNLWLNFC